MILERRLEVRYNPSISDDGPSGLMMSSVENCEIRNTYIGFNFNSISIFIFYSYIGEEYVDHNDLYPMEKEWNSLY